MGVDIPLVSTHSVDPSALATMVEDARHHTLALVADLADEQLELPYLEIVNPMRWELGHVSFFWQVMLHRILDDSAATYPGGADLFDSFRVAHTERWELPLPQRDELHAYMDQQHQATLALLEGSEPSALLTYLCSLCAQHEDMHGEALSYTRHTMRYAPPSFPPLDAPPAEDIDEGDVHIDGGSYLLGALESEPFVWDNEKWAHPVTVAPFDIARTAVTNAEYARFVDAGGYSERKHWSRQGWVWRSSSSAAGAKLEHPRDWQPGKDGWFVRRFDQLQPLRPNHPVTHVSWYEAQAYCSWAGRRLPTEAEWELAASGEPDALERKRRYPWGDELPTPTRANLDGRHCGTLDVRALSAGDSAFGCRQMLGNVWEWTSSAFYPFPGYIVDQPYREYSAPWFGYRKVLKGGAWATRGRLARNGYRNFFTPDRNDAIAGFRTCRR
jgi:iron(II)-dependent oxidoreductase